MSGLTGGIPWLMSLPGPGRGHMNAIKVQGTLLSVPVEDLRSGDLIVRGHAVRRVLRLDDGTHPSYRQVHVQSAEQLYGTDWGYYTWLYPPGTSVMIIRPH